MKSTERHTADTQITNSADYKISSPRFYNIQPRLLIASYRPYDVNNYYSVVQYGWNIQKKINQAIMG
jgi:hypothetical protein